jgi:cytochrome c peroxidase
MFRSHPVELGWAGNEEKILSRLKADSFYARRMKLLFPQSSDPFRIEHIQYCIASFVKTIMSFDSPFDRFSKGNDLNALTAAQKRGMELFFSEKLACSHCHGGINFATPTVKNTSLQITYYFNTGLYNIGGNGNYPSYDPGLFEYTKKPEDMGRFRVPTLRNLAFTAPYFHDGSAASLSEVLLTYEAGGRKIEHGPLAGDGRANPYKSTLIGGFRLTSQERNDLESFLLSLSDSSVCNNSKYANPFINDETEK